MNDLELLRRYRETGSEEVFRELVDRHLGMVYAVALRQVRNPDWADEVAHAVFIALARKVGSLSERTVVAGWLYRATRFAAGKLLRDEERRVRHEKEAAMAQLTDCSVEEGSTSWTELSPLVFEALDVLSRKDRDAILLRFIENRSFAEVAVAIGTSEGAAKMRTGRALEKRADCARPPRTLLSARVGLCWDVMFGRRFIKAGKRSDSMRNRVPASFGARDLPSPKGSLRRISLHLPDTSDSRSGCKILNITVRSISVPKTVRRTQSTEREVCSTSRCRSMDGNASAASGVARTKIPRLFPYRIQALGSMFDSKSAARRCGH